LRDTFKTSAFDLGTSPALVALYAASDQIHQTFVPSHQRCVTDVLLDTKGAALGLLCLWAAGRLRKRWQRTVRRDSLGGRKGGGRKGLKNRKASDIFVSMKTITKRELVRNPALASHLRPGESIRLEVGKEPLVILRRKKRTLTAEDIHTELDRICKGAPEIDTLAVLNDLRE
jgi:hypothetical protein